MKTQALSPTPVSDSVGLGCGPRVCISGIFPGDTDAYGPGTKLAGPLPSGALKNDYQENFYHKVKQTQFILTSMCSNSNIMRHF